MAPAAWLLLLALACPARPQTPAVSTAPAVAAITTRRVQVFDPTVSGEDWFGFRVANKIHILTLDRTVKEELLLLPGDAWDPLKALESERNLRARALFRKAEIVTRPRPDGRLDLDVLTQDAWTLTPDISAGTEGGDNFLIYGISEDNLLGRGKSVAAKHSEIGPRRKNEFSYNDPRLLGSRVRLSPAYLRSDRGDSISVEILRPFFSLDTPYAAGAFWRRVIDEPVLFRDAEEETRFLKHSRVASAGYGHRLQWGGGLVQRVEAGWYSDAESFTAIPETRAGTLPADRELSGPVLGYSWTEPRFRKETYIDKMERVEDFNLGNELSVYGGPMLGATGSDRDRLIWRAADRQGFSLGGQGRFAMAEAGSSGRLAGGAAENALLFADLNVFWQADWPAAQTWVAHLEGTSGLRLDGENQLVLGGDSGLRGYRNNAFTGSRAALLNLEDRVFFPGEYLHLLRWGAAVFFDSGAVAPAGRGPQWRDFRSDIGAGLRLSSTRARTGNVVRIDVAYALNEGPGRSRWVLSVRGQQAFQLFHSATKRLRESPESRLTTVLPEPF